MHSYTSPLPETAALPRLSQQVENSSGISQGRGTTRKKGIFNKSQQQLDVVIISDLLGRVPRGKVLDGSRAREIRLILKDHLLQAGRQGRTPGDLCGPTRSSWENSNTKRSLERMRQVALGCELHRACSTSCPAQMGSARMHTHNTGSCHWYPGPSPKPKTLLPAPAPSQMPAPVGFSCYYYDIRHIIYTATMGWGCRYGSLRAFIPSASSASFHRVRHRRW